MAIPFTQYLRPDGRPKPVLIDRPEEVEEIARRVIARGFRFKIEELATGEVSMDCCNDEIELTIEVCPNGPSVPPAVDKLVRDSLEYLNTTATHSKEPTP